ncbi:melatonin receptor type 1B-like [Lingula anatina]|uniref:Melatonin receptor type 1B-like n=1 Tax=Lingula anatina TaxID=7574 RepID=A0A1S3KAA6_LINAN|nr:melatonin receptor type 1B-like [Lingula anatina]|eukprot:XP_013419181.1 melatonin receptor type 1B-like [Lingula anatina]
MAHLGLNSTSLNLGDSQPSLTNFTPPLIETNPVSGALYVGYVAILVVVGVVSNSVIIGVLAYDIRKKCNKIGSEFLMNLAISDLCVSGLMNPFMIVAATHGEEFFTVHRWLCTTVAAACLPLCFASFFTIACIAVNRYIYTCKNHFYRTVYTSWSTKAIMLGIWLMAAICGMPNFFWGGYTFDKKKCVCTWDRTANLAYNILVVNALLGLTLVVIGVCYYKIFSKIRTAKRNVAQHARTHASTDIHGTSNFLKSIKLVRSLIVVYLVFAVCWIPYGVVVTLDFEDQMPFHLHMTVNVLAHTHASVNCAIFFITNRPFRNRCQVLFQKLGAQFKKVDDEDEHQQPLQLESLFSA